MTDRSQLSNIPARWIFAAIGASSVALLGSAYFLQYGPNQLQPCPLCILQRYAFMCVALVALVAAAHGPKRTGTALYASLVGIFAATGVAIASWQVLKGSSMTSCLGDPVGEFVYGLPMRAWWPEFLAAYGGCADKIPPILGISVPMWSLIWFAGFIGACGFILLTLRRGAK
jgi:disulfide bond formation protein DsbB